MSDIGGDRAVRQLAKLLMPAVLLAGLALSLFNTGALASTRAPGAIDPAAPNLTPEEQLALRYAPIAYLKTQTAPCDSKGEPYAPAPVDVVLGDPQVVLRERSDAKKSSGDPIVTTAPTAADLAGKNGGYYLDLPGNPLHGGCGYERFFKARMGDQQPMVYARIATEDGENGFALQYWFYYVFNRFNNLHESDWEMIQLEFHDQTVADALAPGAEPDEVAYAQHGGGETADWDSDKFQKEGDRPVVYPAAGSHAAYYGNYLYLGWGERGSGLGCDDSSGPSERVPLDVSLMPANPTATGPFSWLSFDGRWGERQPWEFNGPTGPETKSQWTAPFSWEDGLRKSSLPLLSSTTIGPDPTSVFCDAVSLGAKFLVFRDQYVSASYVLLGFLIIAPLLVLALAWRTLAATLAFFVRNGTIFLTLGAVLFVVGVIDNLGQSLIQRVPFIDDILGILNIPLNQGLFLVSGSGVQQLAGWLLVTPAVVYSVLELQAGRRPSFRRAYRFAVSKAAPVIKASLMSAVIVLALAISIVGIPWAIARLVRWMLVVQAIVLDGSHWREAREFSARAVRGRWWRTAVIAAALTILNSLLAPIIGIVVLVFVTPSAFAAQTVSSVVYALLFPMIGIATTFWYQQRKPSGERGAGS
jgi:hypothetical protein